MRRLKWQTEAAMPWEHTVTSLLPHGTETRFSDQHAGLLFPDLRVAVRGHTPDVPTSPLMTPLHTVDGTGAIRKASQPHAFSTVKSFSAFLHPPNESKAWWP